MYIREVLAARKNGAVWELLPERTDLTAEEIKHLKTCSREELLSRTKKELGEYADYLNESSLSDVIEAVNRELE